MLRISESLGIVKVQVFPALVGEIEIEGRNLALQGNLEELLTVFKELDFLRPNPIIDYGVHFGTVNDNLAGIVNQHSHFLVS